MGTNGANANRSAAGLSHWLIVVTIANIFLLAASEIDRVEPL
jgi:hypothetical protein